MEEMKALDKHSMLACAHLVSRPATPLNHLGDRLQIHAVARFPNGVNGGGIGL
ncbi:MAG: hypothetical protein Q9199_008135 [Rusavskia elegans]